MASPSYTYTLANSTTADASQVMQDFNDILNGVTDGTKDLSISALTCAGTATLNGHVNLGNSSADDLSITASLASTLAIKTNNAYDIGSATLGLRKLYLGNGGAGATCDIVSASHATTREYTVPDCSAAASFVMTQGAQTLSGSMTLDGATNITKGRVDGAAISANYIGYYLETVGSNFTSMTSNVSYTIKSLTLPAGEWDVWGWAITSITGADATTEKLVSLSVSLTAATSEDPYSEDRYCKGLNITSMRINAPHRRVSCSANTSIFLVGYIYNFAGTAGTNNMNTPTIFYRRVG